ncbi:cupin domain-containing protein [Aquibaculum sediminis]|uniref:cupin domain-containing protein n=1 Tax=Aquibaculum sediminis TaxID=3231907 RepID=UPI0034543B3A
MSTNTVNGRNREEHATSVKQSLLTDGSGKKIRLIRKSKKLSLKDLSELSGLSVSQISHVERGVNAPSLRALRQLAAGLGVGVEAFFSDGGPDESSASNVVIRQAGRRVFYLDDSGTSMELLTPTGFPGIQTFYSYIAPGSGSGPEHDVHEGSESAVILAGSLDLWLDGVRYHLEPGDSFSFQSTTPHRYENTGRTMTQAIFTISPPIY